MYGSDSGGSYGIGNYSITSYSAYYGKSFDFNHCSGNLHIPGNFCANSYSDCKYKKNITLIESALDKLDTIRGIEFDWNELGEEEISQKGHDVGVIAQEVINTYPQAVREVFTAKNDETISAYAVDYIKFVPLLINSVKELKSKLEDVTNDVALVKNEITNIKQTLNGNS